MREYIAKSFLVWLGLLLYKAFALMLLWNWYISFFFELKSFNYFIALGICLIAEILTAEIDFFKATEKDILVIATKFAFWWEPFLGVSIVLAIGFACSFFL